MIMLCSALIFLHQSEPPVELSHRHQKYSSESPSSIIVCGDNKPFLDHLPVLVGLCVIVGDKAGGEEPKDREERKASVAESRSVRGRRFMVSCFARREARYSDRVRLAGFDEDWVCGVRGEGCSWRRDFRRALVV